ncbi:hypothetical protein [Amphritea sp. HPY]|uniref:hypothetical protein n=1 Tax=Amphritea sp. HPY TaxID=3421652 RepID=UPI003D7CA560
MKTQTINNLTAMLTELRALDPEMNVGMILTLLEVARGNGVTGRDIESLLDTNSTTAARMLRLFDRVRANGKPGLDLVEARIDPTEYRSKLRYLNKEGEEFMNMLDERLKGR